MFGPEIAPLDPSARLALKWPRWYPLSADDRQKDAQTLATLGIAGQISRETAVKSIADTYDIEDIPAEITRISADRSRTGKLMTENERPQEDCLAELRAAPKHSNGSSRRCRRRPNPG